MLWDPRTQASLEEVCGPKGILYWTIRQFKPWQFGNRIMVGLRTFQHTFILLRILGRIEYLGAEYHMV